MKKKMWKTLALLLALGLMGYLGWLANAFLGNPVSSYLAARTAQNHLAATYADADYIIERSTYSFKDGCYHYFIDSPSSMDTEFSLTVDQLGRLRQDTYSDVTDKFVTAQRLNQEYRELTDTVLESPTFPYVCHIAYGTLEIFPREAFLNPVQNEVPAYALVQEELVLDKIYDISELGAQAGRLVIYIDTGTLTYETAAEILLDVRAAFDSAGIPFHAVNLTLQYPLPEEGPRPDDFIGCRDFLYDDITEDGMVDRMKEADQALKAYYASMDGK